MNAQGCYTTANLSPSHSYEVTITIPYRSSVPLDPQALGRFLGLVLQADQEDRRGFDANLFYHGLNHCLEDALRDITDTQMQERYGFERVPHAKGKGWSSRWYLEAEKNPLPLPYRWNSTRVEVRTLNGG